MGIVPNTSEKRFSQSMDGDFADVIKPKEGYNYYRFIVGPAVIRQVWYPTLGKDDDGEDKVRYKTIKAPKGGSQILKMLSNFDKKMVKEIYDDEDAKDYRSPFSPGSRYRWIGFDRDNDKEEGKPTPVIIEVPFTVNKRLREIQQELSKKDPKYLRYGLIYMFDVIVNRKVDKKKKNIKFATEYITEVDNETFHNIKIPATALHEDFDVENDLEGGLSNFFTDEELEALENYNQDLDALCEPHSEEEIRDILNENPPLINAERDGRPIFAGLSLLADPDYEEIRLKLEEATGLPMEIMEEVEERPSKAVSAGKKKKSLPAAKKKKPIEEAEYEEVEEEEEVPEEEEEEEEEPEEEVPEEEEEEEEEPDPPAKPKLKKKSAVKGKGKGKVKRRLFDK